MYGAVTCLVLCVAAGVRAQENPDDAWELPPLQAPPSQAKPAAPEFAPPPMVDADAARGAPPVARPRPPVRVEAAVLPRNSVGLGGATPLGAGTFGALMVAGFPFITARVMVGATDWLDVGLGLDSMWGIFNEPLLAVRAALVRSQGFWLGVNLEGGPGWFLTPAKQEVRGPRFLTGRRNGNLGAGLAFTFQGEKYNAVRFTTEVRYLLGFDTEPFSDTPLGGVPSGFALVHSASLKLTGEVPLSSVTAVVIQLGLDAHFGGRDSPLLPSLMGGLTVRL